MEEVSRQVDTPADTEWLRFGRSDIHGLRAFARRSIPPGTRVIEYIGERIDKQESLRRCELNNEYIFALDEWEDLDGNVERNAARFINHSCRPNCEAECRDEKQEKTRQSLTSHPHTTFHRATQRVCGGSRPPRSRRSGRPQSSMKDRPLLVSVSLSTGFGSTPLQLHEKDALPGGAFRRRLVAQTDDPAEAEGVMELLNRRCFTELPGVA